MKAKRADQ